MREKIFLVAAQRLVNTLDERDIADDAEQQLRVAEVDQSEALSRQSTVAPRSGCRAASGIRAGTAPPNGAIISAAAPGSARCRARSTCGLSLSRDQPVVRTRLR